MERILLINGSPKGKKSNTYRLATAFLEGMRQAAKEENRELCLEELQVNRLDIRPCLGCFSCWSKTPGQCCIHDDMSGVLEKLLRADVVIWSFPLYYFSVPGPLKQLIDRQLPLSLPFMEPDAEGGSHPSRYDMTGKRHVVISTCGFYTARGNYDGVTAIFDHMCGHDAYTTVFCGQGELFRVPELAGRTEEYLRYVRQAGTEYVRGGISANTRAGLEELLFPREIFEKMADASWGVSRDTGEKEDESLIFTRQMAALYRKENYRGKEIVLEMEYTDIDKRYQIILGPDGSRVLTDGFLRASTMIETPYSVWKEIAAGKISGEEALMKQLYRVKGDFSLMTQWDSYFGEGAAKEEKQESKAQTTMTLLLAPWITFWVAAAIDSFAGSLISIAVCTLSGIVFYRNKKTVYDIFSQTCVALFSVALLAGAPARVMVPLSYLTFGIMWTLSCFRKIPLTAHYSMNNYQGEKALGNPLFVKTNRILTLLWGILYLLTPIWTFLIMGTSASPYVGAINSVLPAVMGVFTAWFQKWYPAKVARGE